MLLSKSIEIFYVPNIANQRELLGFEVTFAISRSECFTENKNILRLKTFKN